MMNLIRIYSITNIIDLHDFEFEKLKNPKKRTIKKSETTIGIKILEDHLNEKLFKEYYEVLQRDRELKNVKPTHTLEELIYLKKKLKDKIILFSALIDNNIAGICILFLIKKDVILNFYLAAGEEYKKDRVSDFILFKSIEWAKMNNFRIYDIGTSNVGNNFIEGLFDFKKKFMADGFLRKSFSLEL
jgi:lipid II:glycine glycyltransferase (peptidoglycan interpeptide bridge formation enzyme)